MSRRTIKGDLSHFCSNYCLRSVRGNDKVVVVSALGDAYVSNVNNGSYVDDDGIEHDDIEYFNFTTCFEL